VADAGDRQCHLLCPARRDRLEPAAQGFPALAHRHAWFTVLHDDGTWKTINHHPVMRDRERGGREASLWLS